MLALWNMCCWRDSVLAVDCCQNYVVTGKVLHGEDLGSVFH